MSPYLVARRSRDRINDRPSDSCSTTAHGRSTARVNSPICVPHHLQNGRQADFQQVRDPLADVRTAAALVISALPPERDRHAQRTAAAGLPATGPVRQHVAPPQPANAPASWRRGADVCPDPGAPPPRCRGGMLPLPVLDKACQYGRASVRRRESAGLEPARPCGGPASGDAAGLAGSTPRAAGRLDCLRVVASWTQLSLAGAAMLLRQSRRCPRTCAGCAARRADRPSSMTRCAEK